MILLKPIITEKSMSSARRGIFTFLVKSSATKSQIKQAIEETYQVHVVRINVLRRHVPANRTGTKRLLGKSSSLKLSGVKLKAGESIDLFELKEK